MKNNFMTRLVMFSVVFLMFSVVVNADIETGLTNRFPFTSNVSDVVGSHTLTNSGVDFTNNWADFNNDADYIATDTDDFLLYPKSEFTMCMNFNTDDVTKNFQTLYAEYNGGTSQGVLITLRDSGSDGVEMAIDFQGYGWYYGSELVDNQNYTSCLVYDQNTETGNIYLDNTSDISLSGNNFDNPTGDKGIFGSYDTAGHYPLDGQIWEVCVWNRTLTQSDINTYYEAGCVATGGGTPASTEYSTTFTYINNTLVAENSTDTAYLNISWIGYNITNATSNFGFNITSGTLDTPVLVGGEYGVNKSLLFAFNNSFPFVHNNKTFFNSTWDTRIYENGTSDLVQYERKYIPQYAYWDKPRINATATNLLTGNLVPNATFTLTNLNTSEVRINFSDTGNFLYRGEYNTVYNLTADNPKFATYLIAGIGTTNATYPHVLNLDVGLYTTNSFNITFLDESDLKLINDTTITLDLISDKYANTYTTSNGSMFIGLLTPENYTFRYYGSGFNPRLTDVELTNRSHVAVTLYLLPSGDNITLNVIDTSRSPVENANIKIERYSTDSNSYVQINSINTNFEGKAVVDLEKNSEFYRFYIYYNGVLKKSTTPAYITGDEITFTISLDEELFSGYFNEGDYTYRLSYNSGTKNFKWYYDSNTEASQGCLDVDYYDTTGRVDFTETCNANPSGTILVTITNVTGRRYIADGYMTIDGEKTLFSTLDYQFRLDNVFGTQGTIFIIFLTVLFMFIGFYSLPVAFILTPLPLLFGHLMSMINTGIPLGVFIGIEIAGIILGVLVGQRS